MDVSRELLFFFSALGAFNGMLMGLYFLLYVRPKHTSNTFLGLLLLMLSVRIGKSVIFYFNPDLAFIYLQIGLTACFFIGPCVYFYVKSFLQAEPVKSTTWLYHFAILSAVVLIGGILYPFEHYVDLWRDYFISGIYYQWLAYLVAALFLLKNVGKKLLTRKAKLASAEIWLLSVYIGNVFIWFAYYTCLYTSYIAGALSFSFIFYLLILLFIMNKQKKAILFQHQPKYVDKKIAEADAVIWIQKLEKLMLEEELFKNPNLKLSEVANRLHILPHRLSQLLNDNLGQSFTAYINAYRIESAKKLIRSNETLKLEAIGYDCGFNSKSTFYAAFKRHTGTTPARFKNS